MDNRKERYLQAHFAEQVNQGEEVRSFVESPADSQVIKGYQFFKIYDEHQLEYILLADGDREDVYMFGKDCGLPDTEPAGGI